MPNRAPVYPVQHKTSHIEQLMAKPQYKSFSSPSSVFQVTLFTLSGVGGALLLILLVAARSRITCQKTEVRQVCDAQVDTDECK